MNTYHKRASVAQGRIESFYGTLAKSEDQEKMPQNAASDQIFYFLQNPIEISIQMIKNQKETKTHAQ